MEFKYDEVTIDIICQVLVKRKSKELIYQTLNEFIPDYEPINLDYTGKPADEDYDFKSEDEMISCYIEQSGIQKTFYWNKKEKNPNNIMVGVNILVDDQMVFSLTFDGTLKQEAQYYKRLKKFLKSDIGVISYIIPVDYESGHDFETQFGLIKYDFEK